MKYILRSVKYFVYLAVLFFLLIGAMVLLGFVEASLDTMFRNGTESLKQIAVIGAVFALIYPRFGYCERAVPLLGSLSENLHTISEIMTVKGYVLTSSDDSRLVYRKSFLLTRIVRMGEDRITVTADVRGTVIEGRSKDVVRIVSALEARISGPSDQTD